ncbi:hypothetical protein OPV22_025793 [Ensete ventricosum]|uniref:VQ domain-containing protein n=1 Tax=Ensete ventricosum TaxID=4639 RepID=A0AAV8P8H4_ENSVE|nr:hypothetical protein OPV22_025793 [Ensete ventricosum]RWV88726.1 hypothetical protein GW17_00049164 [Ensete ventricosum]RWW37767.1 hypothetical protein BHE74_00057078 [Ensete ventricosum]RZS11101.1 hypothetical protein BHM03_00042398 [Ensete ventricosum]
MSCKRAPAASVKVTVIETQFVETDSASFKSVVQRLTGKDSAVAGVALARPRATRRTSAQPEESRSSEGERVLSQEVMAEAMFKELEWAAAMEPCLEEWYKFWN